MKKIIDRETYINLRIKNKALSNADFASLLKKKYTGKNGQEFNMHMVEARNVRYQMLGTGDQTNRAKTLSELKAMATKKQLEFYKQTKDFKTFRKRVLVRQHDLKRKPRAEYLKKVQERYVNRIGKERYNADAAARMRAIRAE